MDMFQKIPKEKWKRLLSGGSAIVAVSLVYLFFHIAGIGCPIRFFTGISCPGCGMTRAVLALLRLDFAAAFYYHPLVYVLPIAFLDFLFQKRIPYKFYKILIFTFIGFFVTIYIVRLCDSMDSVVQFQPEQGFVFRAVQYIFTNIF